MLFKFWKSTKKRLNYRSNVFPLFPLFLICGTSLINTGKTFDRRPTHSLFKLIPSAAHLIFLRSFHREVAEKQVRWLLHDFSVNRASSAESGENFRHLCLTHTENPCNGGLRQRLVFEHRLGDLDFLLKVDDASAVCEHFLQKLQKRIEEN